MTGKARGFKKGDLVFTGLFPAVIISDVGTYAPCCEVWGLEHESGSVYADDLKHMKPEEFVLAAMAQGHDQPFQAYSQVAKKALAGAGINVL